MVLSLWRVVGGCYSFPVHLDALDGVDLFLGCLQASFAACLLDVITGNPSVGIDQGSSGTMGLVSGRSLERSFQKSRDQGQHLPRLDFWDDCGLGGTRGPFLIHPASLALML